MLSDLHPERWPNHPDGPLILRFHDRDIALDPDFMEQLFTALPGGYKTLGMNQYMGILHTNINSTADRYGLRLAFSQGAEYCSYFATHPSSWRLWLSDPVRERLAALHGKVSIGDRAAPMPSAVPRRYCGDRSASRIWGTRLGGRYQREQQRTLKQPRR